MAVAGCRACGFRRHPNGLRQQRAPVWAGYGESSLKQAAAGFEQREDSSERDEARSERDEGSSFMDAAMKFLDEGRSGHRRGDEIHRRGKPGHRRGYGIDRRGRLGHRRGYEIHRRGKLEESRVRVASFTFDTRVLYRGHRAAGGRRWRKGHPRLTAPRTAVVLQIAWYLPHPADFSCFGADHLPASRQWRTGNPACPRVPCTTTAPLGIPMIPAVTQWTRHAILPVLVPWHGRTGRIACPPPAR